MPDRPADDAGRRRRSRSRLIRHGVAQDADLGAFDLDGVAGLEPDRRVDLGRILTGVPVEMTSPALSVMNS